VADRLQRYQPSGKYRLKYHGDGSIRVVSCTCCRIERRDSATGQVEAAVRGTDREHLVRLGVAELRCTCPWFAKHRNKRGPCKHVLAVQFTFEDEGLP
jgi:uncharacterized Zn finger protein